MVNVDACPKLSEIENASRRFGCGHDKYGTSQYMCTPNKEKTSLVEFCYDGVMGIEEKGKWCDFRKRIWLNNQYLK